MWEKREHQNGTYKIDLLLHGETIGRKRREEDSEETHCALCKHETSLVKMSSCEHSLCHSCTQQNDTTQQVERLIKP